MWRYLKYSYKVIVYVHSPYEQARSQCPSVAYAFSIPALSMSKCRYLQSLLQCAKANALRLNELSHTELMYIAALTPTQFAIYRSYGTHRHSSKRTPPHEQIYKYIAKLAKPELIFTIDYICTRNKMQLLL